MPIILENPEIPFSLLEKNRTIFSFYRECIKTKYKLHIALLAGLNFMFICASRDMAPIFFNLHIYFQTKKEFNVLTQIYCIANFFFPLFFGYITDYIGYKIGLMALHLPIILGSLFFLMATVDHPFNLECVIVGRLLFSIGGESLQIILLTVVVGYFKRSNQISYGLNVCLSMNYLGYALIKLCLVFEILAITNKDLILLFRPSLYGLFFGILSFLCSGLILFLEKFWNNQIRNKIRLYEKEELINLEEKDQTSLFILEKIIYPYSFWQAFKKVLSFRLILVSLINGLMIGSFYCIITYNRYFFDVKLSNLLQFQINQEVFSLLLYALISFTIMVLVGGYIDKTKQRNFLMMLGGILCCFSCILFSNTYENLKDELNIAIMSFCIFLASLSFGLGMGFSLGALYASIPCLVKEENLTMGFGVFYSIGNAVKFLLIFLNPSIANSECFFGKNPFWFLTGLTVLLAIILEFYERRELKNQNFNMLTKINK